MTTISLSFPLACTSLYKSCESLWGVSATMSLAGFHNKNKGGFSNLLFFISKCSKPLCSKGFRGFYELIWKSLKSLKIWPVARRLHFGCTPVSSIFHCIIRVFFKSKYMVFFQKNEGSAVWRQLKGAHRMRKVSIHYVT